GRLQHPEPRRVGWRADGRHGARRSAIRQHVEAARRLAPLWGLDLRVAQLPYPARRVLPGAARKAALQGRAALLAGAGGGAARRVQAQSASPPSVLPRPMKARAFDIEPPLGAVADSVAGVSAAALARPNASPRIALVSINHRPELTGIAVYTA